jgi:tyrosyl-tRNA synthetase
MYGKVMSISDPMMWRYYELLTDVQLPEIEKMKRESHPMDAKKDLARRIVTDFHSAAAAAKAAEDWAKQFQKDEVPKELERVEIDKVEIIRLADTIPSGSGASALRDISRNGEDSCPVRIDKMLRLAGLAVSNTEAAAKIKSGAVGIEGEDILPQESLINVPVDRDFIVRVGRRMKRLRVVDNGSQQ